MLARDEQKIAKTLFGERARFANNVRDGKSQSQNRVVSGEAAVLAIIDALVRKIERCEQPHRSPKMLERQRAGTDSQAIELDIIFRRNQRAKRPNRLAFFQRQIVEYAREFHDYTFRLRRCVRKSQGLTRVAKGHQLPAFFVPLWRRPWCEFTDLKKSAGSTGNCRRSQL